MFDQDLIKAPAGGSHPAGALRHVYDAARRDWAGRYACPDDESERTDNMNNLSNTDFVKSNLMGPDALMLLEELCERLPLRPGMRILDLGCGCGLTSIRLAQKYFAQVFATDLWIPAEENFRRFQSCGLDRQIVPIHADVHDLPFSGAYFDALVCIDSYPYYGAKEGFLDEYIAPLVKPGGIISIAVPGLLKEFDAVPAELLPYWTEPDMGFHDAAWWTRLMSRSHHCVLNACFSMDCHKEAWDRWLQCDHPYAIRDRDMMKAEGGKYFDTIGLILTVNP